jgi:pimeloyl-ACP methyl ester carboxylesterase
MPVLHIGDCRIRYETWGEGPPVVLLHGFTSSIEQNWVERSWVSLLTEVGRRVIGVDLRGHGRSSKFHSTERYETPLLGQDVARVLDELELARADVFGFSLGAGVALQLAMDAPPRVRRLLICGIGDAAIRGLHDPREIEAIRDALAADNPDGITSLLGRRVREAAERGDNDLPALAAMAGRGGWPGDLVDPSSVDAPVLLGISGRDEYMTGTVRLLELLPSAEVVTVPEATHTGILGHDTFKRAVLRFLAQADGR